MVQLFWPENRARPFTKVVGINVGGASRQQIVNEINASKEALNIELVFDNRVFSKPLIDIGYNIDSNKTAEKAVSYPIYARLIPFSLFSNLFHKQVLATTINNQQLKDYALNQSQEVYIGAFNATIEIEDTKVKEIKAQNGIEFPASEIEKTIKDTIISSQSQRIVIKNSVVKPVRTQQNIADTTKTATEFIKTPFTVQIAGEQVQVTDEQRANWLTIKESTDKKNLQLDLDTAAIKTYLEPYQEQVQASGDVSIDVDKSVVIIKTQLAQPKEQTITLPIVANYRPKTTSKTYAKDSSGLQQLLADIARSKGDYAITVQELGGTKRTASYAGTEKYVPASTYKLFVAYSVLKRIDNGTLSWDSQYFGGLTVKQCLETMIVDSDNECANAFGDRIGWQKVHNEAVALGLKNTKLYARDFASTTDDQVLFLNKLLTGNIISSESRDYLLSIMKRQVYRQGVPAGTKVPVADKVGFLNGLLHDTAIVYSPSGTYLVSIYTYGSSWASIADAAKQIHNFLNS